MALGRGKPRQEQSGKHEYSHEQSLSFWKQYWRAQIEAQPPKVRRETVKRAHRLMSETRYRSALHELAVCYRPVREDGDDDGECLDE